MAVNVFSIHCVVPDHHDTDGSGTIVHYGVAVSLEAAVAYLNREWIIRAEPGVLSERAFTMHSEPEAVLRVKTHGACNTPIWAADRPNNIWEGLYFIVEEQLIGG